MLSHEVTINERETAATVQSNAEIAEIQAAYIIAARMQRNVEQARIDLLSACKRPRFAESAMYSIPYQNKPVTGLSIRFAEEALRLWGNVRTSVKTTFEDEEQVKLLVAVTDLQTNVGYSSEVTIKKEKEVRKVKGGERIISERLNSYGDKVYLVPATSDDIKKKVGAAVSKKIRNGALKLIPSDIKEEAEDTIVKTQHGNVEQDIRAARRKILDAFNCIGVSPENLEKYLGQEVSTISAAQLSELRNLYTAIRDGATSWKDVSAQKAEPKEDITDKTTEKTKDISKKIATAKKKAKEREEKENNSAGENALKLWDGLLKICKGSKEEAINELNKMVGTKNINEVSEEQAKLFWLTTVRKKVIASETTDETSN